MSFLPLNVVPDVPGPAFNYMGDIAEDIEAIRSANRAKLVAGDGSPRSRGKKLSPLMQSIIAGVASAIIVNLVVRR